MFEIRRFGIWLVVTNSCQLFSVDTKHNFLTKVKG